MQESEYRFIVFSYIAISDKTYLLPCPVLVVSSIATANPPHYPLSIAAGRFDTLSLSPTCCLRQEATRSLVDQFLSGWAIETTSTEYIHLEARSWTSFDRTFASYTPFCERKTQPLLSIE